jgi:hypothetical protein
MIPFSIAPLARRSPCPAALCLSLALLAGGTAQAASCTDFSPYANDTVLPERFSQDGFRFQDKAGGHVPVVTVFFDGIGQPVHGMRFDDRGLRVRLPQGAAKVELKAGPFGAPGLTVRGFDASGQLQRELVILPDDGYLNTRVLRSRTAPITELRLSGGGNNGVLDTVCLLP